MFNVFNRRPVVSSNPTTVTMTKYLSNDYFFEREDHQPNFRFRGKRYANEEAALDAIKDNVMKGDIVEFIDTTTKTYKTYVKGSNKCTVHFKGGEQIITTNF